MGHGSSLGPKDSEKRSKLGQVKSVGSSYNGVAEWLTSRIQALIAIPTSLYIFISLLAGVGGSYTELYIWLSNPFNASVLILAIVALCWHGALGVMTVINDYIHNSGINLALSLFVRFLFGFIVVLCSLSILFFVLGN